MAVHPRSQRGLGEQRPSGGAKAAKRHQAVADYWQTHVTLQRWCRIRSYLDSALAHGFTALDAITRALEGSPWLPAIEATDKAAA